MESLFPVARRLFADFLSAHVGAVGPLCGVVAAAWVADKHRYHPPRTMEWTWTTIGAFSSRVRRDIPLHLLLLTSSHFSHAQSSGSAEALFSSSGVKNRFAPKYWGSYRARTPSDRASVHPRLPAELSAFPSASQGWGQRCQAGDGASAPRRRAESWPEGPVRDICLRRASLCWPS